MVRQLSPQLQDVARYFHVVDAEGMVQIPSTKVLSPRSAKYVISKDGKTYDPSMMPEKNDD
jgi:hypothetical protein